MIPKVIHYCWFGGKPLPEEYKKNIETWKKFMPDYKIIKWDETNYDYNKIKFTKEAYESKKWAFVTDYARLDIIYNYGGIYLDTDVEVIKKFDDLLNNKAFMGIESGNYINTGLGFGAIAKHKGIKANMKEYEKMSFYDDEGLEKMINCPMITTNLLKKNGAKLDGNIENVMDICIYPMEFFCPLDYYTGKMKITSNTYSIHKYSMSWGSNVGKKQYLFQRKMTNLIGKKLSTIISKLIFFPFKFFENIKSIGIKKTLQLYVNKFKR